MAAEIFCNARLRSRGIPALQPKLCDRVCDTLLRFLGACACFCRDKIQDFPNSVSDSRSGWSMLFARVSWAKTVYYILRRLFRQLAEGDTQEADNRILWSVLLLRLFGTYQSNIFVVVRVYRSARIGFDNVNRYSCAAEYPFSRAFVKVPT